MVSNKKKGDDTEKQIMSILQSQGYNVIRSPRTMKRVFLPGGKIIYVSQANDFFGLFDLCAKKDQKTVWIQCKFKDPTHVSDSKKGIVDFNVKYCCSFEQTQIWLKVPKTGFIIYEYRLIFDEKNNWKQTYVDLKGNPKEPFKNREVQ